MFIMRAKTRQISVIWWKEAMISKVQVRVKSNVNKRVLGSEYLETTENQILFLTFLPILFSSSRVDQELDSVLTWATKLQMLIKKLTIVVLFEYWESL